MNIDEMIAVLQAAKDGKQIQLSSRDSNPRKWINMALPCRDRFNFINYEYRVMPEPLTLWVNLYIGQTGPYYLLYSTSKEAVADVKANSIRTAIKFVEVSE